MDEEHDPHAEGYYAYLAGKDETSNPYDVTSDDHASWNDGWHEGAEEFIDWEWTNG